MRPTCWTCSEVSIKLIERLIWQLKNVVLLAIFEQVWRLCFSSISKSMFKVVGKGIGTTPIGSVQCFYRWLGACMWPFYVRDLRQISFAILSEWINSCSHWYHEKYIIIPNLGGIWVNCWKLLNISHEILRRSLIVYLFPCW